MDFFTFIASLFSGSGKSEDFLSSFTGLLKSEEQEKTNQKSQTSGSNFGLNLNMGSSINATSSGTSSMFTAQELQKNLTQQFLTRALSDTSGTSGFNLKF